MRVSRRRVPLLLLLLLATVLALTAAPAADLTADAALVKTPPVPSGLPSGIEDLAAYVGADSCSPTTRPGTVKLGRLLSATYPGTTWSGARSCGALPDSEHHEGRAVDWMNSIRNAKQKAQAGAVIGWLFAPDAAGRPYANARRLGIMYLIWDGKIWGAYSADQGWRPYRSCAQHPEKSWDTTCHRDHMHLSLSWAGALGHTSFWTKHVAAPDYGRCRAADMNWTYGYKVPRSTPCPDHSVVKPPQGASATLKTIVDYSGRSMGLGSKNAGVTAVQKAIGTQATGSYSSATVSAMKTWQRRHGLEVTGKLNHATWRALRQALTPK